ncbi:hypothetical protein Tco_0877496 [Tanacetum coccineum]|uniref:Uncharacterized protein n=1 Tax=Tanacetum coccineum TaxID=301880 RepID=A0ABQ5BV78_9ASTR
MSYTKHPSHKALFNALALSLGVDEYDMEKELNQPRIQKKRRRDDHAQYLPKDAEKDSKKKKRKDSDAPSSKKTKDQPTFSNKEEAMDDEEPVVDEVVNTKEHLQHDKTTKDPGEFDDLMGSTIDFPNFIKHRLKKDKITKADLEGLVFKLLKGACKSSIELEYHLDQRYLTFSDQLDWTNPEGDRCPYDLSKPLPLQGPLGHLTIHVGFFFNNDLEYLKNGNKERKYDASVTKIKATKYDLKFIEDMIPRSRNANKSPHEVSLHLQILGVVSLMIDNQFGYGYLKEIVVRRADLKEYSFREADFSRLYLNDIEDLSIVIQKRVEDVQLRVESYQKKLNITKP